MRTPVILLLPMFFMLSACSSDKNKDQAAITPIPVKIGTTKRLQDRETITVSGTGSTSGKANDWPRLIRLIMLFLPRRPRPNWNRPGLVAAIYPGSTSEQVEKQVTKTLEKHIFKFPEVRISGDDIHELKRLGSQVQGILAGVPFSQFVHQDYYNDSYMVEVNVNKELANRLGITDASVSRLLAGAFDGGPVSTFWEGDRPVTIMLRLDQDSRPHIAMYSIPT